MGKLRREMLREAMYARQNQDERVIKSYFQLQNSQNETTKDSFCRNDVRIITSPDRYKECKKLVIEQYNFGSWVNIVNIDFSEDENCYNDVVYDIQNKRGWVCYVDQYQTYVQFNPNHGPVRVRVIHEERPQPA